MNVKCGTSAERESTSASFFCPQSSYSLRMSGFFVAPSSGNFQFIMKTSNGRAELRRSERIGRCVGRMIRFADANAQSDPLALKKGALPALCVDPVGVLIYGAS